MAFFSPGAGVPISTASNCVIALDRLSRALGIGKPEAYRISGLNEEAIKINNDKWDKLATAHIERKGLGAEFTD